MFLFQKYKYHVEEIKTLDRMEEILYEFIEDNPAYTGYDTETTGLNIITSVPFLLVFGWKKKVFSLDLTEHSPAEGNIQDYLEIFQTISELSNWLFAHNAGYDYHMMYNAGSKFSDDVKLADTATVFRLTTFADDEDEWNKKRAIEKKFKGKTTLPAYGMNLEFIGARYVDDESKFAGKVIKDRIKKINDNRKKEVKAEYDAIFYTREARKMEDALMGVAFGKVWKDYNCLPIPPGRGLKKAGKRIPYIDHEYEELFQFIDLFYKDATYYDVFLTDRQLMINYAYDDVIIMLEYLNKVYEPLQKADPDLKIFTLESDLIKVTAEQEREGLLVDVDYILQAREDVLEYQDWLYTLLRETIGIEDLTVGQHALIQQTFAEKYGITMISADSAAFKKVIKLAGDLKEENPHLEDAILAAKLIRELRTVDKWMSTYIEGTLKKMTNGKIHAEINNNGTISGRVSSDKQQEPNKPIKDTLRNPDNPRELYHPRKAYTVEEGYVLVSFDYSQQELRVQANQTYMVAGGDFNLMRAYCPFRCYSEELGEYEPANKAHQETFEQYTWYRLEDDTVWEPNDVHDDTTLSAFPEWRDTYKDNYAEFDKTVRKKGKMTNFLSNYGGGWKALMEQLDTTEEEAKHLSQAYYETFPVIRDCQSWITEQMDMYGRVQNDYGRYYYMSNPKNYYKLGNYYVQGGSAYMVKLVQIKAYKVSRNWKSKFLLPIHDEVMWKVAVEEMDTVIPAILAIMKDTPEIEYVPLKVGVEMSSTSWADMEATSVYS